MQSFKSFIVDLVLKGSDVFVSDIDKICMDTIINDYKGKCYDECFIVDINNPEYMFENIVDDEYSQWNELLNKIISI